MKNYLKRFCGLVHDHIIILLLGGLVTSGVLWQFWEAVKAFFITLYQAVFFEAYTWPVWLLMPLVAWTVFSLLVLLVLYVRNEIRRKQEELPEWHSEFRSLDYKDIWWKWDYTLSRDGKNFEIYDLRAYCIDPECRGAIRPMTGRGWVSRCSACGTHTSNPDETAIRDEIERLIRTDQWKKAM